MRKLPLFGLWMAAGAILLLLPSLCLAADLQWATLRLASSEGVGIQWANSSTSKGAVVLLHTELVNWGNTVQVIDISTNLPVDKRNRIIALDYCVGTGAQGGGTDVTTIVAPMGLCLVEYDILSEGGHRDFVNGAWMATVTANLLNLPPAMVPLFNAIGNAIMGMASTPTPTATPAP